MTTTRSLRLLGCGPRPGFGALLLVPTPADAATRRGVRDRDEADRAPTASAPRRGRRARRRPATNGDVTVNFDDVTKKPSTPILVLLGLTLLSLVPAILLTCTSFTKILVVLSLTRNALGLQQIPPEPGARRAGAVPEPVHHEPGAEADERRRRPALPERHQDPDPGVRRRDPAVARRSCSSRPATRRSRCSPTSPHRPKPDKPSDVALTTLIPAFILSELKQAFIIGFMIFIPFLVIDIVVSAGLMSLGMMMMPPVMVSLPVQDPAVRARRRVGTDHQGPRAELRGGLGT